MKGYVFFLVFLLCFLELHFLFADSETTLYSQTPSETKYECEVLHRGTVRYMDRLKLLRRSEARVKSQGLPMGRFMWPMHTEDNKSYECSVPYLQFPQEEEEDQVTPEDTSMEVTPFLQSLHNTCIYRWEGWWTYEFCYGKHVRQFHQEQDGTILAQFYLGQEKGKSSGALGTDYYSEEYEEGSECELTGKPRTCEVRFYCDSNTDVTIFSSVKEPSSCNYVIQIDTPIICKHPKYVPKVEEDTEKILCFETPVPTENEVQEEEEKQKKQIQYKQQMQQQKLQKSYDQPAPTPTHPESPDFSEKIPIHSTSTSHPDGVEQSDQDLLDLVRNIENYLTSDEVEVKWIKKLLEEEGTEEKEKGGRGKKDML